MSSHTDAPAISQDEDGYVSTGTLPSREAVRALVETAHERFRGVNEGKLADYIPALAEADAAWFGICMADTHGDAFAVGDAEQTFSIQSVSKPFAFALVCDRLGCAGGRESTRCRCDGARIQFGDGDRASTWAHDQSAGELGRNRNDEPSARRECGRTLGQLARRPVPLRGARARARPARLRIGGRAQRAQLRHRPPLARLRPRLLRPRRGHRRLHAAMLAARIGARSCGHGRHTGGAAASTRGQASASSLPRRAAACLR